MNPAHLDYEALAELAEGLLDDRRAASAGAHLDDCAQCRSRAAEIADVSRILAESPVPPMPAGLAGRIDAALAAESMQAATVTSLQHRRGRRHLRVLSAAAATVVVLGGGAVAGAILLDSGIDGESSTATHGPLADRPDRSNAAPEAPGDQMLKARPGTYPIVRTGTDYRADTMPSLITRIIRGQGARTPVDGERPSAELSACVTEVAGARTPVLVDIARYQGRPATVIALPGGTDGGWSIWVVGPECTTGDADAITSVTVTP